MNWESILDELNNNSDKNIPDELLVVINFFDGIWTFRTSITGFCYAPCAIR